MTDLATLLAERDQTGQSAALGMTEHGATAAVPASETVLKVDRWGRRRGADLSAEWQSLDAGAVEPLVAADVIASDIDAADKQLAAAIAGVPQEPKEPEPTLVEEFERLKAQQPRDLFDQSAQEQEAAAKSFPALAGREIWASPSTPSDPAIASLILRRRIN